MDVINKMAYISATSKDTYEITCKIAGLDTNYSYSDRYVKWYYNNSYKGTSYIGARVSSGGSLTATGLSPNTKYSIEADIYYSGGLLVSLSGTATTRSLPQLTSPTLNTGATIKTNTSVQITMYTVAEAERYYARINGGTIYSGTGRTFNFTGLSPNTQYLIEIKCSADGYLDSDWAGYLATTLSITSWEWWYPKVKDGSFNLTAGEWLAFCNKINEIRVANGLGEYGFTTSSTYIAKDKPYYAWIYNQAKTAIDSLNTGYTLLTATSGDMIRANEHFNNLKNALNSAI